MFSAEAGGRARIARPTAEGDRLQAEQTQTAVKVMGICFLVCTILFAAVSITLGALTLKEVIGSSVLANYCIVIGSLGLVNSLCFCAGSSRLGGCLGLAIAIALIVGGAMVLKGAWPPSTLGYMAISHGSFSLLSIGCIISVMLCLNCSGRETQPEG